MREGDFIMDRTMRNRSPAELIAMATGRRGAAAYADAQRLVEKLGLKKLADAGSAEIREICQGMAFAARLGKLSLNRGQT